MGILIDPWGSFLIKDYERLIGEYRIEPFTKELLEKLPNPNKLMRRFVVFGHTDLQRIIKAIENKEKFYALSGIMPSYDKIHFGNKMVIENLCYFQNLGAKTFVCVADLEALATRKVKLEESRERALNFHIPAYIALGLDPKKTIFYFQSENEKAKNLCFAFSSKITTSEFKAIYGSLEASRIISSLLQAGDILFPQLENPMPGIIPVGPDQSPHILLTRDVAHRTKSMFGFIPPSAIYHKFTPALNGELKMSKSKPQYCISIPEEEDSIRKKIMDAFTGGRFTLREQRELGGEPEKCTVFELYKQHLVEYDEELNEIYRKCKNGELICGECKLMCIEKMLKFMKNFEKKLEKARKIVDRLKFLK